MLSQSKLKKLVTLILSLCVITLLSVTYLSSDLRDAVAFILLILILLLRPNGLLGRSAAKRA